MVRWRLRNWRSSLWIRMNLKAEAQLQQGLAATSDENLKAVINLRPPSRSVTA